MSHLLVRQKHATVPSSDSPPFTEWTAKFWYMLRTGALQAKETLTDDEAELLVKSFEALSVTLPCKECRAHFKEDWAAEPYTAEHAKDLAKSVKWVEDLRAKIDARIPEKAAAKSSPAAAAAAKPPVAAAAAAAKTARAPAPAPAAAPGLPPKVRSILGTNARVTPISMTPSLYRSGSVRDKSLSLRLNTAMIRHVEPPMPSNPAAAAAQRNLAISSAVAKTRSNRTGGGGCGCRR